MKYRDAIREALYKDFRKPAAEVDLTEVLPITSEAKFIKRRLRGWMHDARVRVPLSMIGNRSRIHYEPKGVVLIMAPWNFPYQLCMGPLMSAFAAGNSAILKPSETAPHTSALLKKIVKEYFRPEEAVVFEGGVDTSQLLLKQPFNHIFFTGSPRIGKIIMKAASEHLSSVTLELGGKSPTVVDQTARLRQAAFRIMWSKCLNAGQICIAPDYIYVHESIADKLIDHLREATEVFYNSQPRESQDFARIVDEHNYQRLKSSLDDALEKGAHIEMGGQTADNEAYIAPTVLTGVTDDMRLMHDEIFGPILPIKTFRDLREPIEHIQSGEKPLAMYIYSRNKRNIRRLIHETRVGGTSVNIGLVHFFNHHLPFGGSNHSGIGKAHGYYGFLAFSNARGISHQRGPSLADATRTPYTRFKQWLIDFAIKWL